MDRVMLVLYYCCRLYKKYEVGKWLIFNAIYRKLKFLNYKLILEHYPGSVAKIKITQQCEYYLCFRHHPL